MDGKALEERLHAVERTLTGEDVAVSDLEDEAELLDRLDALEDRADDLDDRIAELDAGLQAVRGYVGNVRTVNREVERQAEAALATAEGIADDLDDTTGAGDKAVAGQGSAEARRTAGGAARPTQAAGPTGGDGPSRDSDGVGTGLNDRPDRRPGERRVDDRQATDDRGDARRARGRSRRDRPSGLLDRIRGWL
ncbi:MAG: hypothetical protein ABEJ08_04815 [Halobacteriaceae archaeon]